MCHDWWLGRRFGEREESRRMWEEFEHTHPLSQREQTEDEPEVTLEERERTPLPTER
jgi:hypothetical protein